MSRKVNIWLGVFVGSIIGGYLPMLFGSSLFSFSSLFGNTVGALIGLWVGYKISDSMGL